MSLNLSQDNKIGIIAGSGSLPLAVIRSCIAKDIAFYIVAIENVTDVNLIADYPYKIFSLGKVGGIIKYFQDNDVNKIVFAGSISRPNLISLKVDAVGSVLLAKLLTEKFLGDNQLLVTISKFIETHGFKILKVQDFLDNFSNEHINFLNKILTNKPNSSDLADIKLGMKVLATLSEFDIGQAIIIEEGHVLGIEGAEGTDHLINRCSRLRKKPYGGVLIKAMKFGQDERLDMPVIGINTINNLIEHNYYGLALHNVIILDEDEVIEKANDNQMFVFIKEL